MIESNKSEALRALQELAKADGFKRLPDEKAFMDDLSGEPEIIIRNRLTLLSDAELILAREWWAGLSDAEQMRRRERAVGVRTPFGIELSSPSIPRAFVTDAASL